MSKLKQRLARAGVAGGAALLLAAGIAAGPAAAWQHHRHARNAGAQDCSSHVYFGWLAEQRINQAVLMDSMALDQ